VFFVQMNCGASLITYLSPDALAAFRLASPGAFAGPLQGHPLPGKPFQKSAPFLNARLAPEKRPISWLQLMFPAVFKARAVNRLLNFKAHNPKIIGSLTGISQAHRFFCQRPDSQRLLDVLHPCLSFRDNLRVYGPLALALVGAFRRGRAPRRQFQTAADCAA
jgi:hypothetical protein